MTTLAVPGVAIVQVPCEPLAEDGLRLVTGHHIRIIDDMGEGWYAGEDMVDGAVGIFPASFVVGLPEDQPEDRQGPRPTQRPGTYASAVRSTGRPGTSSATYASAYAGASSSRASAGSRRTPVTHRVRVMLDYEAADESELSLEQGDVVQVLGISEGDSAWWIGRLHGQLGRFPAVMVDPQPVSDEDNDSKDDDGARGQSEAGEDERDWELVVNPGSPRTTSRRSSLLPLATPSRVLEDLIHSALTSTKSVDPDELNNLLVAVELAAADEAEDGRGDLGDRRSSSSSSSSRADEAAEAATTVPERRAESENEEEEEEEDTGDPQAEPQQAPDVETYHHETKPLPDLPMTCGCCDDDVDFGAMVQCTQGHLFCPSCLSNYAAMNITEYRRTTFKCFSQEEVCDGTFTYAALVKALPEKLRRLYDDQLAAASTSSLPNFVKCPFCADGGQLYECTNPECGKVSCRRCQRENHPNKRCHDLMAAEEQRQHSIEERMTDRLLRKCPKCHVPFFKVEGCNRVTCPTCKIHVCYVCRATLASGYDHFCQHPHTGVVGHGCPQKCGKCLLHTNSAQDDARDVEDERKRAEAGKA